MPKPSVFENKAFQKREHIVGGFHLVPKTNNFNALFNPKDLDEFEAHQIENLLYENFQPGTIAEEQVADDSHQMKRLTVEVKAVAQGSAILIGERVYRAKQILKPYKDGTFTQWLEVVFGNRKSGYNMLAYFEFYQLLPHPDLKEVFNKIPKKAAYTLASRAGDIETKVEIIRESQDLKPDEILELIQEKLPISEGDRRSGKTSHEKLIAVAQKILKKLRNKKDVLSERNRREIIEMRDMLETILAE